MKGKDLDGKKKEANFGLLSKGPTSKVRIGLKYEASIVYSK